jgi:transcriptional regulator with XRE-family HTH domain
LGEKVRIERERLGYTLEQVEEETKIRKLYLNAIEEDNYAILPPRVYAIGFVKRYARLLKLNPDELAEEFKLAAYGRDIPDEPVIKTVQAKTERKINLPVKNILIAAIFLIMAIWAGSQLVDYISGRVQKAENPAPPPAVNQPVKNEPAQPAARDLSMVIEAKQKCWLEVWADGQPVYCAILPAGGKTSAVGKKDIRVKAGNAGGIDLFLNNRKMESLGKTGEVKEKTYKLGESGQVMVIE